MMQQQQPPTATLAPGNPIGYAPIYGPSPTAPDVPGGPQLSTNGQGNATGGRWIDGLILGGLVGGTVFALSTWGILDGLYSGADIRGLQRAANAANATAQAVEQRAANAEANAQQWQVHSQTQEQTIEDVRALVCR